jgi:hypothetical protein
MDQASVTDKGQVDRFDLTALSEVNYMRHRVKRYIVGSCGCIAFVALLFLGVSGILTAVPFLPLYERYFFTAVGALIGYLCLSLAWVPFRYWAAPPVALSVSSNGLDFLLRSGRRIDVAWKRDSLRIELLERVSQHGLGQDTDYRIWVMWARGDFELVWRRVVPLTYTSEAGLHRVLDEARNQHLSVRRIDHSKSLSMFPTVSRTAYIISREGTAT